MVVNPKIKQILSSPYMVATAFFIFFVAVYLHFYHHAASSLLEQANSNYKHGENAQTIAERKNAFNKALEEYLKVEETYDPRFGNGKLYYNIGNTYYQLGEYPMAVLYYYRAIKLSPYDSRIENNLTAALKKLDLPPPQPSSAFAKVFFFHALLPLPHRLQLFFFLAVAAFAFASYTLWFRSEKAKLSAIVLGGLTFLMLMSLGYTHYLENPDGIIVRGTYLYRGAGKNFAPVNEKPLKAGNSVEIFQSNAEGTWLKVETSNGDVGYVPNDRLRYIF